MDMDISDILASVSRPQHGALGSTTSPGPVYDASTSYSDHQLLTRAWTSERTSPSLLPYPSALISRTMSRIQDQISKIEDLTSGVSDPFSSAHAHALGHAYNASSTGANTNLVLSILQTDLGRTQFIVRSFLRCRLSKLTKHAAYYLKRQADAEPGEQDSTSVPSAHSGKAKTLLSSAEVSFLRHHQALLTEFYESSFLASFPPNLRRLDDNTGGVNMVEGPDTANAVVVRCLRETWDNETEVFGRDSDRGGGGDKDEEAENADERANVELRFRRGEVWVARWRDVRMGVVTGDLELL